MRKTALMFVLAGLVGALVATPIAVYASHQFIDVPNSNPFHDDIDWLADAAVTLGCSQTQYCPKDNVTREQMAAFLRRLAENQVVDAAELEGMTAEDVVSQCPSSTTLFVSVCIEDSARPALEWGDAADVCAAQGRRLPSGGELHGFREQSGVTLAGGGEWSDDLGDVTLLPTFVFFAVSDTGNGVNDALSPLPYRCVAGLG